MSYKRNMTGEDKWIEETLGMSEKIRRVEPANELLGRIRSIPVRTSVLYNTVSKKVIWSAAAGLALLISLNFLSVKSHGIKEGEQAKAEAYFSYLKQL